jgi:hypothetical protein
MIGKYWISFYVVEATGLLFKGNKHTLRARCNDVERQNLVAKSQEYIY